MRALVSVRARKGRDRPRRSRRFFVARHFLKNIYTYTRLGAVSTREKETRCVRCKDLRHFFCAPAFYEERGVGGDEFFPLSLSLSLSFRGREEERQKDRKKERNKRRTKNITRRKKRRRKDDITTKRQFCFRALQ